MPGAWLTVEETAELTGVTTKTVRRLIHRGELPARRIGSTKMIRVAAADIDKLMRPIPADGFRP
jgi:excisionase family DNA binding protein